MAEVIVRQGAQADILEAALWYESRRPGLGSEFTLRFDALVERIAQTPLQFPEVVRSNGRLPNIRLETVLRPVAQGRDSASQPERSATAPSKIRNAFHA